MTIDHRRQFSVTKVRATLCQFAIALGIALVALAAISIPMATWFTWLEADPFTIRKWTFAHFLVVVFGLPYAAVIAASYSPLRHGRRVYIYPLLAALYAAPLWEFGLTVPLSGALIALLVHGAHNQMPGKGRLHLEAAACSALSAALVLIVFGVLRAAALVRGIYRGTGDSDLIILPLAALILLSSFVVAKVVIGMSWLLSSTIAAGASTLYAGYYSWLVFFSVERVADGDAYWHGASVPLWDNGAPTLYAYLMFAENSLLFAAAFTAALGAAYWTWQRTLRGGTGADDEPGRTAGKACAATGQPQ